MAALLSGCDLDQSPDEPRRSPRPTRATANSAELAADASSSHLRGLLSDAGVLPDTAASRAAAANSALMDLRTRRLELAPRRVAAQLIAFGKGRIAQLGQDAAVVLKIPGFAQEAVFSIAEPRRVLALQDGSLLVAGRDKLLRLQRGKKHAQEYRRIPILAESLIFRDRRDASRFWLLHRIDPTLYQYELQMGESVLLDLKHFIKLEGFDHRGLVALKDGSFLYTAGQQMRRFFPHGKLLSLESPLRGCVVWRILTTYRIDRMWVACEDGKLHLVQIGPRLRVVRSHQLPSGPYDLAADDSHIALVRVTQPAGQRREWWLTVLDRHGRQRVNQALPNASAALDAEWVRTETQNRSVALSRRPPLVAVGGPTALSVWDIKTGKQLHSR